MTTTVSQCGNKNLGKALNFSERERNKWLFHRGPKFSLLFLFSGGNSSSCKYLVAEEKSLCQILASCKKPFSSFSTAAASSKFSVPFCADSRFVRSFALWLSVFFHLKCPPTIFFWSAYEIIFIILFTSFKLTRGVWVRGEKKVLVFFALIWYSTKCRCRKKLTTSFIQADIFIMCIRQLQSGNLFFLLLIFRTSE